MSITAKIDRPKLEKSLKRFSKDFGETSAQAVVRWSVQTCRELAVETLPWKSKDKGNPKKQQQSAIEKDLGRVVFVQQIPRRSDNKRVLKNAADCIAWMDQNRTTNNRTKKLPASEKKVCSPTVFKAAVRTLMKRAGIAKGGFLGAGMEIAKAQKGPERMTIGKNFLGYAQKHSGFGSAVRPRPGFTPKSTLTNRAAHTSSEYVLKKSSIRRATDWALKKTVKWYQRALKAQDKKTS
jgi:hypothetical protein